MKLAYHIFLILIGAFLVTGCVPSERFWWSPDGSKAAVVIDGGLHIVDASGKSVVELGKRGNTTTESVNWTADADSLVAHSLVGFASWEDAKAVFPEDESRRVEELSSTIPAIVETAVSLYGDTDNLDGMLNRLDSREPDLLRCALFLQWERDPKSIEKHLEGAPELREKLVETVSEENLYFLNRIERIELSGQRETIVESVSLLTTPIPSPNGQSVAYGRRTGDDAFVDLIINSDGQEITAAKHIYSAYTWTSNRSLIAIAPVQKNDGLLKQVREYHVDETAKEARLNSGAVLANVLIPFLPRVNALPDGSVLFASQEASFPAQQLSTIPDSYLYRYMPGNRLTEDSTVLRVPTAQGELPANLGYFSASPDGKRVAVVESDTDAVAVVEIETGNVVIISEPHPHAKCRTLPAWRNDNELTFARLDEKSGKVEWVLWNTKGETRILNQDWPHEWTADWIEIKKGGK